MPRAARVKVCNGIYHVMIRSISEVKLFKNDSDKIQYLDFLKECQKFYVFKTYAFCLMNNHAHFIIDSCGSDISKVMHRINLMYSRYYNRKYKRHGHLFQDRFKSKLINSDRYLINLSLYIHNNPKDINKYKKFPEKYRFSSLGAYLNLRKEEFGIVDKTFISSLIAEDSYLACKRYLKKINRYTGININEGEFKEEKSQYISGRKIIDRNITLESIFKYIKHKYGFESNMLNIKNRRETQKAKAILVVLMRSLGDFRSSEISEVLGNITYSRISKLCGIGIDLIFSDAENNGNINDFLKLA
jgi:Transposase and inactivated derivatives